MKPLFSIVFFAAAMPAHALSCLPPDPVSIYTHAKESDAVFWIIKGRIDTYDPVVLPKPDNSSFDESSVRNRARLTGEGLQLDGRFQSFARDITLELTCLGPWCAQVPDPSEDVFVSIEVTDDGPVLSVDPCYSRIAPVTDDGEERLLNCVMGKVCETKGFPD